MKNELFDELLESVKQAGAVMCGDATASRVFAHPVPELVADCDQLDKTEHSGTDRD